MLVSALLHTPAQRTAFEQLFIRPHTRTPGVPFTLDHGGDIVASEALLRHPDFVVARMKGHTGRCVKKCSTMKAASAGRTNYVVNCTFH